MGLSDSLMHPPYVCLQKYPNKKSQLLWASLCADYRYAIRHGSESDVHYTANDDVAAFRDLSLTLRMLSIQDVNQKNIAYRTEISQAESDERIRQIFFCGVLDFYLDGKANRERQSCGSDLLVESQWKILQGCSKLQSMTPCSQLLADIGQNSRRQAVYLPSEEGQESGATGGKSTDTAPPWEQEERPDLHA